MVRAFWTLTFGFSNRMFHNPAPNLDSDGGSGSIDQIAATNGGRSYHTRRVFQGYLSNWHQVAISYLFLFYQTHCYCTIFYWTNIYVFHIWYYFLLFSITPLFQLVLLKQHLPKSFSASEVSRCIESMVPIEGSTDGMHCPICLDVIQSADDVTRIGEA